MKKYGLILGTLAMIVMLVGAILYASTTVFASTTKSSTDPQVSTNTNPSTTNVGRTAGLTLNSTSYITEQQVNGIEIEIIGKQVVDNFLLVDMCFQLPDDNDWLLGNRPEDITLTVGDKVIPHAGWSVVDSQMDGNGNKLNCDRVKFQLSGQEDLNSFVITVNHLITSIPEQPNCDKAQAKLDKKNTGIKIKCSKSESSFSYEIAQKPNNMSDYDLRRSIEIALSETIDGPWVFTDSLNH